ncbi:phage virion morphogenesis protein [Duncaniella muris]|uniref:phage virion morphogenesis protein n=1 Tax=Duncaniella muris TaxID=2094150 RepID=UPI0025AA1D4A|nr:phage virion morphogenesis protein [Duncaniella muris]
MQAFSICLKTLMMNNYEQIIKNILRDIQVEMTDEFDRNFERQAFFSEAWQRRKSPTRPGGHILVDSGGLRQSIMSYQTENSIVFRTEHPAAAIHNEGGEIKVTAKMKRFFWYKYCSATGSFGRRKDGSIRKDKRTVQLSTEAEFWKFMALMKVGSTIKIPRRQFLGNAPEVEQTVREIIEENITEFFNTDFDIIER